MAAGAFWSFTVAALASTSLTVLSVVNVAAAAPTPVPATATLKQRLRILEDRAAIEQLITSDYANAIDLTDTRALSELFTDDGEFASEWLDMSSLPEKLRAMFTAQAGGMDLDKLHPQIGFKGRATIANYMSMVFRDRPVIRIDGTTALATFELSPAAAAAPPGPPPGGPPPANPMLAVYASMKHLITNPRIALNGDEATASSYWIEVAIGKDGKQSIAGSGYYTDTLRRVGGRWRFSQRVIHNYDPAPVRRPGP